MIELARVSRHKYMELMQDQAVLSMGLNLGW